MAKVLDSKIPAGPVPEKWKEYKAHQRLVNPKNKLKLDVIVVGTGLAGASAAASLAEMGFNVYNFCIQDSPRRAHSIAAQGGINAAKNYQNDGDSVYRLFYDTVKGGDYRAREANVYRLAEVSNNIIEQCVAQGVPFAREGDHHAGAQHLFHQLRLCESRWCPCRTPSCSFPDAFLQAVCQACDTSRTLLPV